MKIENGNIVEKLHKILLSVNGWWANFMIGIIVGYVLGVCIH